MQGFSRSQVCFCSQYWRKLLDCKNTIRDQLRYKTINIDGFQARPVSQQANGKPLKILQTYHLIVVAKTTKNQLRNNLTYIDYSYLMHSLIEKVISNKSAEPLMEGASKKLPDHTIIKTHLIWDIIWTLVRKS